MNLNTVRRIFSGKPAVDGFQFSGLHPLAVEHERISKYLKETADSSPGHWYSPVPDKYPAGREMLSAEREEQARLIEAAVERIMLLDQSAAAFRSKLEDRFNPHLHEGWMEIWGPRRALDELVAVVVRKRLPFTQEQVAYLAKWGASLDTLYHFPTGAIITAAEELDKTMHSAKGKLPPELVSDLEQILVTLGNSAHDQSTRKWIQRLQVLLGKLPRLPLQGNDAWSVEAAAEIVALPSDKQAAWIALLHHCTQATGGKPSAKWMKESHRLVGAIGKSAFTKSVGVWFPLVDKPRPVDMPSGSNARMDCLWISDYHADLLRTRVVL